MKWLQFWLPLVTNDAEWTDDWHGHNALLTWRIVADNDAVFRDSTAKNVSAESAPDFATPPSDLSIEQLKFRLDWKYPHAAATHETAKTSVTALRKRIADEADAEARHVFRPVNPILAPKLSDKRVTKLSAVEIGIAHHTFQQYVAIERTATELDLRNEAGALLDAGLLMQTQHDALNFGDLAAFWQSDTGSALRKVPAPSVNREMEFTARLTSADLKRLPALQTNVAATDEDFIVVQGQIDLAVLLPEEIWLLDFKTDDVDETGLVEKVKQHTPQLETYASALEKIYRRPVTRCWLHFLRARKTVEL